MGEHIAITLRVLAYALPTSRIQQVIITELIFLYAYFFSILNNIQYAFW